MGRARGTARVCVLFFLTLACSACRAFPVGLFVPDEVLAALAQPSWAQELDERVLAREIEALAGTRIEPAVETAGGYWRLDAEPALGPFCPADLDRCTHSSTGGLASGDLVLVKMGHPQSLAITLTLEEFNFYDHVGVLVERRGRWLVCDSWPDFRLLGKADDFASRFRGGVRATPLASFLAPYETALFVRLPDEERSARLAACALASLGEGLEYDPRHDPADPRVSCTEYLQLLLERAGFEPPRVPRAVGEQAELRAVLAALGFGMGAFVAPDQFAELPGARSVAWISRHSSRAGARAIEAAFALLHARFRAGGRLADFLGVGHFRLLRYRSNVAAFLGWAEGWAIARGVEERAPLERELAALVPLFFGPTP